MRTLLLVLAMTVVVAGASVAATATIDIYEGWNLIAAPLVPFDADPLSVFAGAAEGIDGLLSRMDPLWGGVAYDSFDPEFFGNILLGDGYWLLAYTDGQTLTYDGVENGVPDGTGAKTDMWISLPGAGSEGGWHFIGNPFAQDVAVDSGAGVGDNIFFTDGTDLKNWNDAVAADWVDSTMYGEASYGGFGVTYDGFGEDDSLRAGKAYQFLTFVPNIAMIVPAPADAN
ncbi:MAG: hypothetical protein GX139_11430 [Armatimonadetes bacterium]|nr:hypothetical protein [Armatimonadota bacterium]